MLIELLIDNSSTLSILSTIYLLYSATAINLRALDVPIGYWSKGTGPIDTAIITTLFKGIYYLGTEISEQSGEMGLCRDVETEGMDVRYREHRRRG
jgi:hypothetical protein